MEKPALQVELERFQVLPGLRVHLRSSGPRCSGAWHRSAPSEEGNHHAALMKDVDHDSFDRHARVLTVLAPWTSSGWTASTSASPRGKHPWRATWSCLMICAGLPDPGFHSCAAEAPHILCTRWCRYVPTAGSNFPRSRQCFLEGLAPGTVPRVRAAGKLSRNTTLDQGAGPASAPTSQPVHRSALTLNFDRGEHFSPG